MFTGIIESIGEVMALKADGSNIHITVKSEMSKDSYIDQSISHDGVCLTVVRNTKETHTVTAIHETIIKTNFDQLAIGGRLNLERAMLANSRMDGHIVQGHVDGITICENIQEEDGSWIFTFAIPENAKNLIVDKGSICINGVSLTIVNPTEETFSVAIIPYTFEHTSFCYLEIGDAVNLEYDIIGKYVARYLDGIDLNNYKK